MEKEIEKYFEPNEEEEIKTRQNINKNLLNIVNNEQKICLTCDRYIPYEPEYKKQCVKCYKNKYTICYNCKTKKSNSYAFCYKCFSEDGHGRVLRFVENKDFFNFYSKICENCNYNYTFQNNQLCSHCFYS